MSAKQNSLLSLALIMKNAADEILTCLESCAQAVDEIVIADTGSTDDSVAVVRTFLEKWQQEQPGRRAELMEIEWQDDFSAARNQVLALCRGDFVLALDSDESLSEDTRGNLRPLLEALGRGGQVEGLKPVELPDRPTFASAEFDLLEVQRANVELDGTPVPEDEFDFSVRIFRRRDGLSYLGEVHERLGFKDGTRTKIAVAAPGLLRIIHTGYRSGVKEQKDERNFQILLKEEAQGGHTNLKYFYLADTYHDRKQWLQAFEAADRCLKEGYRPVHDKEAPYRLMYEAARELEKEARLKAGLPVSEGGLLPEEKPDEPEAMKEVRKYWKYGESILSAAIREFPDYPGAYFYLALRRKNRGDRDGSWRALRLAEEMAEKFPQEYPEEDFKFREHLTELQEALAEAGKDRWVFYLARSESLGGRYLRKLLEGDKEEWQPLEGAAGPQQDEARPQGLLLPFLEMDRENLRQYLPKVALALQQARGFRRTVVMLREPLPEVLALLQRHQQRGLPCTAVCAGFGELFGGERPGELSHPAEELLELTTARVSSASPRKRLLLPCREDEKLSLTYAGDLAGAVIFVLCQDKGLEPLLVAGSQVSYGQLAKLTAEAAGFTGRLQYGKARIPKPDAPPDGLRLMQKDNLPGLKKALAQLVKNRLGTGLEIS